MKEEFDDPQERRFLFWGCLIEKGEAIFIPWNLCNKIITDLVRKGNRYIERDFNDESQLFLDLKQF